MTYIWTKAHHEETLHCGGAGGCVGSGWYTLGGVRVEKPQRGVYIHGGRKVVVK